MNQANEETNSITATLVPEEERLVYIEKTFGIHFPIAIEPIVYGITERMAEKYHGGYWNFYSLSNSGFYMAPEGDEVYSVTSANYFQGEISSDAMGIVSCATVYSHLSFSKREGLAKLCARHYYLLREFINFHPELAVMLRILD
jgi:antirestriction protein